MLIYSADPASGEKHQRAKDLIRRLIDDGVLALSVQNLNEFYSAATKSNKPPSLPHDRAVQAVQELVRSSLVLPMTASMTLLALDAMPRYGLSFWDALIWAAAKENGAAVIYTEDFQHGRDVEGVRFVNPFLAAE